MARDKVGWVVCELLYGAQKPLVVSGVMVTQSGVMDMLRLYRSHGRHVWAADSGDRTHTEVIFNEQGEVDMAGNRVYLVSVNIDYLQGVAPGAQSIIVERLVRAANPAQAERHVYGRAIAAKYAEQADLERLLGSGLKVEDAA